VLQEQLENWFQYHAPSSDPLPRYVAIRAAGLALAQVINDSMPDCADKSAAIRMVREAVITANARMAGGGK
jgi:hypothetical protein